MSEVDKFLDSYDKKSNQATAPTSAVDDLMKTAPAQDKGMGGLLRDAGLSLAKGVVAVPEAVVGLADIATGGRVGKALENEGGAVGFRPKQAKEFLGDLHTEKYKDQQRQFQEADGILEKTGVALSNPSMIANAVVESVPVMGMGGAMGRAGLAAGRGMGAFANPTTAAQAARQAAFAGAAGEGVSMAGSQAEAIRQETADGLLTPTQSGAAALTGVIGTAVGAGSARLARYLGIGDADTMLAQGASGMAKQFADDAATAAVNAGAKPTIKSIPRKMIEGAITEGFLEELPQSMAETVLQNLALGKPWYEKLDEAAVMGVLTGGAMGAGAAGFHGFKEPTAAPGAGVAAVAGAPAEPAPDNSMTAVREQWLARAQQLREAETGEALPPQTPAPDGAALLAAQRAQQEQARLAEQAQNRALETADDEIYQSTGFADRAPVQRPSEAMGLDPNAGSMSAAAALAVDSGATDQLAQIASAQAQAELDAKDGKGAKMPSDKGALESAATLAAPAVDADGVIADVGPAVYPTYEDAHAYVMNQRRNGASVTGLPVPAEGGGFTVAMRGTPEYQQGEALRAERMQAERQAKASAKQQEKAPLAQDTQALPATNIVAAPANLKSITAKQIPAMTDVELQQAIEHYGPEHKRTAKLQKEVQRRAADTPTPTTGAFDGPQADQTQQTSAQPTQAAAAPDATAGLTNGTTTPQNLGAQAAPAGGTQGKAQAPDQIRRARLEREISTGKTNNGGVIASLRPSAIEKRKQELDAMGERGRILDAQGKAPRATAEQLTGAQERWQRMTTAERQAVAARTDVKPILRKNLHGAKWENLNVDVQRKLQGAMEPIEAQPSDMKAFKPETGTLGVPRSEMPQVPSQSHGGLVKHLNSQGISHETTTVDAGSLKPTQAEYSPAKVEAAKGAEGGRAVIVSKDGHIIDGHHQAMAAAEDGKPVKAIVLDAPVEQALEAVRNSPSAQNNDRNQAPALDAKAPEAIKNVAEPATSDAVGEAPALQATMKAAGWTAEVAGDGNAIWIKEVDKERYTSLWTPETGSMEVTVLVDAVDTQIASFKISDPKAAADAANKAVASDVADSTTAAPASAEQRTPAPDAAPQKPAATKSRGVAAKMAEAAEKARADYFTPGNIIKSYGGHDRVVSYLPPDADGRWSVTVRAVRTEGGKLVDIPGVRERTHATQPDARELKAGPVLRAPKEDAQGLGEGDASVPANDRDTFTLQRMNQDTRKLEPVTFVRGEYVRHKLGHGEIDGISQARSEFRADGVWQPFGFAYKAERPAAPNADTVPLSSAIDKVNAKNGQGLTDADRVPGATDIGWDAMSQEQRTQILTAPSGWSTAKGGLNVIGKNIAKRAWADIAPATRATIERLAQKLETTDAAPASKTPMVDRHNATMAAVRDGKATAEEFRTSFDQVVGGKVAIVAELDTMTKAQLLREGGAFVQMRYANEKKADVVDAVYREMVGEYALGETVTYSMGKGAYEAAVRKMVEATDADKLARYVTERTAAIEENQARRAAKAAAIENPQTLNDFREALNAKIREGMNRKEAFLTLTPEQRIQYDTLEAESTREARETRKRTQKTLVRAAGQTTAGEIVATKHTRDGYDLFVVKLADRLGADDYKTVLASAKKMGGWYSAFRGNGAIPGFQFKDKANAEAFLALAGGDTTAAQEQVAQRRDAFEDDRSQTAVERLRTMADKLEAGAAEAEGQQRKTNTERRARFASAALQAAANSRAKAQTMRNIAQVIEDGEAKFLDAVRTKSQVDMLTGVVNTAKMAELRTKHPRYADQERHKGEPPTAETADFADFPSYSAFRSDLATLGRQMLEVEGTKKLGQQLMKIADDVTDAYLAFAKEHLTDVQMYVIKGGEVSTFGTERAAELAIVKSGFRGKAIPLQIKRGQYTVILSPSEAMNRGIWKGDGDKRITLTADSGRELVEAIGRRGNKQNQLSVPWQFQTAYDRLKALASIGIETPSEFRAALREFISLKAQAVANRTRELELQMVGRKADGLDFFPTSAEVADQMIEAADLTPDMAVLEPSAGMGHLADRIREAGAEPDVIEISSDRRELLEEKGYTTQAVDDFLDLKPRGFFTFGDTFRAPDGAEGIMRGANGNRVRLVNDAGDMVGAGYYDRADLTGLAHNGTASGYDRIIMNPPFSNRHDAEHVRHAFDLLKPGGRIVAIMGEGVFFGQDKKAQDFREWLEAVGGTSEKLPEGSFMDPSLPVNTGVNARMVVIDKPVGDAVFSTVTQKPAKGLTVQRTQDIADRVINHLGIGPVAGLQVFGEPGEAGFVVPASVVPQGATRNGKVYLFATNISDEVEAFKVVVHELFHLGLSKSVPQGAYIQTMLGYLTDPQVRQYANRWKETADGVSRKASMPVNNWHALAVEEALADLAEEMHADRQGGGTRLQGWAARMASRMATLAERMGMAGVAGRIRSFTHTEAEQFVQEMLSRSSAEVEPLLRDARFSAATTDQTQTEAFKRWFGDSKVVDADGKPLVVYHGTDQPGVNVFEGRRGVSAHFAFDADVAWQYAEGAVSDNGTDSETIYPAYLSAKTPFDVRKESDRSAIGMKSFRSLAFDDLERMVPAMKKAGFDSFYDFEYIAEGGLSDAEPQGIAVFRPEQIKSATGNRGTFDPADPDIRFSRAEIGSRVGDAVKSVAVQSIKDAPAAPAGEEAQFARARVPKDGFTPAARKQAVQAVEKTAVAIRTSWANGPEVVVAFDMNDPVVPDSARRADLKQRSGGARGAPEGFYYRGKVYLMASRLNTPADVARVLFHEALGHHGLRGAFGGSLAPILNQIATMRKKDVDAKIREYGLRGVNSLDRRAAAEEVLAEMAQNTPTIGFVRRAVAAIRTWLRKNVPGFGSLRMTDNEIIRNFILPARQFVERGGPGGGGVRSDAAFSRGVDDGPMFSRSKVAELTSKATAELNRNFNVPGKLNWWHKSIGTMYNLAERSPEFKPVFEAAQGFVDDVSHYATDAAELAPKLLPKLEDWKDITKSPVSAADHKAVAKPVFEGTLMWARDAHGNPVRVVDLEEKALAMTADQKAQELLARGEIDPGMLKAWQGMPMTSYENAINSRYQSRILTAGVVWTDAELKDMFKLTDGQIGLYKEFRAATNRSLDTMARADMLRFGGDDLKPLRSMVMDAPDVHDAAKLLREHLAYLVRENPDRAEQYAALVKGINDRADKVAELQGQGYAPLSRFGRYTVDVVVDGNREYFGLFETQREANDMAAKMRQEFGVGSVSQGTMSNEAFKLFAGITPESLELFGNMLGLDSTGDDAQDKAFQEYLRLTKTNRSAMKRLIHRKGIAGYSEDVGRVLASFVYSNSRQTAAGLNMGDLGEAVSAIPQNMGELKDAAIRLAEYVKNPQEEAQAIRGLLFAQYLGGSIASAFVNMSQPVAVTFPWLSQFGGAKQAATELTRAAKQMATKGFAFEPGLARALHDAEEDGTVSPQEVHQLMAQASGRGSLKSGDGTRTGDAKAAAQNGIARLSVAWGKVFGAAEQVNRRMTFIAAYRVAVAQGHASPSAFAKKAVTETQFLYSKANKMQFARGAIGGTLMTFKTYSVAYLELLHRMYTQGGPEGKKAALLALGMLMLMGGAGGLPFMEDAEDVADALAQMLGYNFSSKQARKQLLEEMLPKGIADFIDKGVSGLPGAPLDVSGRLGMGNLIPGTGVLLEKTSHTRDVMEIAGPMGDFATRILSGTRKVLTGDVAGGVLEVSPTAVRNAAKGVDMATTGMYRDAKGYKVLDTNTLEAALKSIGFQPASVATVQEANGRNQQAKNFYNLQAQEIRSKWARGIFEDKQSLVDEARADIADWNRRNPDQPMLITVPSVMSKVREMRKPKDQRIADSAPKAMRAQMREELQRSSV